jgi:hypothetical protein
MFNALLTSLVIVFAFLALTVIVFVTVWLGCDLLFGEYYYWKKLGKFFVNAFHIILGALITLCAYIVHILRTGQRHKEARQYKIFKISKAFLDFKTRA